MGKFLQVCLFLVVCAISARSQEFGLFNTGTLYDAFENPAQKHFKVDYSRKYSTNFLLPLFGAQQIHIGKSDEFIRSLIQSQTYSSSLISAGKDGLNRANLQGNFYLLAVKSFYNYKNNVEIGLSAQIKTDVIATYPSELIEALDNYENLTDQASIGIFNNHTLAQSYYQFSASFRKDIDKQLSFGVKASYLSGITYNHLHIQNSILSVDNNTGFIDVGFSGFYHASFFRADEVSRSDFTHLFRNPGLSITGGFQLKMPKGLMLMGNIKDLGFIKWNKKGYAADISFRKLYIDKSSIHTFEKDFTDDLLSQNRNESYFGATNAKADISVFKKFGDFSPALIVSKNLLYPGGSIALVNTYHYNGFSGSLIPSFNFIGPIMLGLQGMYKTPNFELYGGSNDVFKTISTARGLNNNDPNRGSGYNGASVYLGVGIKFGRVVQKPMNSDYIPGLDSERKQRKILNRIFGFKSEN